MPAVWGIVIAMGLDDALAAALGASIIAGGAALGVLGANLTRRLPWPLNIAAGGVAFALSQAIIETVHFTTASAQGFASMIQAPWQAIWTVARSTVVATEQLAAAVLGVSLVTIPRIVSWTQGLVQTSYVASVAYAHQQAAAVASYALGLVAGAMARADAEYVTAVAHADQVGGLVARYAHDLVQAEMARTDAEVLQVERFAQAETAAALGYAQQLAGTVLEYVQAADHALELQVERVLADSSDYARALERVAVDHADAAAGAAAATAAAATAAVVARVTDIENSPCMKVCSPLGEIGQMLQGLEEAGLVAAVLAMAARSAHDPSGTADELATLGSTIDELVKLGRQAIGA